MKLAQREREEALLLKQRLFIRVKTNANLHHIRQVERSLRKIGEVRMLEVRHAGTTEKRLVNRVTQLLHWRFLQGEMFIWCLSPPRSTAFQCKVSKRNHLTASNQSDALVNPHLKNAFPIHCRDNRRLCIVQSRREVFVDVVL